MRRQATTVRAVGARTCVCLRPASRIGERLSQTRRRGEVSPAPPVVGEKYLLRTAAVQVQIIDDLFGGLRHDVAVFVHLLEVLREGGKLRGIGLFVLFKRGPLLPDFAEFFKLCGGVGVRLHVGLLKFNQLFVAELHFADRLVARFEAVDSRLDRCLFFKVDFCDGVLAFVGGVDEGVALFDLRLAAAVDGSGN